MQTKTVHAADTATDVLPLLDVDHLEFYVGNAKQAAYYYRAAFGFQLAAYAGPETGVRDRASYLVEQGRIRFVLTTPLRSDHPIGEQIRTHGDTVRDVALEVASAERSYQEALGRGARGVREPVTLSDSHGEVRLASIATYGDTIHTFVERRGYTGSFLPGFLPVPTPDPIARPAGLKYVDHLVGNVGGGEMDRWVAFYRDVLGFELYQHFDETDISTEYSALMSKVMAGGKGRIKFPINEPADGRRKSQIQEYLDFHGGPGVQHIAMGTADIIESVFRLSSQGVEFLRVPAAYYETLSARVGEIQEPIEKLAKLGILVDRDDEGYMLQIFTKPVEDRPTLFFEIIQRRGSRSFGKGNFKALFEAMEREQARRGNL
jgi:4-hydroxyphenylpyruvate dioxygenase